MKCCMSTDFGTWTNWLTFEPDPIVYIGAITAVTARCRSSCRPTTCHVSWNLWKFLSWNFFLAVLRPVYYYLYLIIIIIIITDLYSAFRSEDTEAPLLWVFISLASISVVSVASLDPSGWSFSELLEDLSGLYWSSEWTDISFFLPYVNYIQ